MFNKMLLATAAVIVTVAGASAADLPSKKAAPATYVKICDTYGAGFFYIPGSDTCLKVGGRVRYDLTYVPTGKYFSSNGLQDVSVQDTYGQHVRARINMDARTGTDYGTVRTYLGMRVDYNTGLSSAVQSPYADTTADKYINKKTTLPFMDFAFIQFAGFTAGKMAEIVSGDWFGNMMGYSRYASFSTGVFGISYTAVLGGGLAATVGFQDNNDFDGNNVALYGNTVNTGYTAIPMKLENPYQTPYDALPVLAGKLAWDQSWGQIQVSGGVARNRSVLYNNDAVTGLPSAITGTKYDLTRTGYAFGGQLMLNADMVAKGDKFYLLGGMSSGLNKLGFKNANVDSGLSRDVDGIPQSFKNFTCNATGTVCEDTKSSWGTVAYLHYWTPSIRQNLIAGVAQIDPGAMARAASAATQKATYTQLGTNVFWSPTKGFDIGVEVMYNRSSIGSVAAKGCNYAGASAVTGSGTTLAVSAIPAASAGCSASGDNFTTRLRIQRDF